MRVVISGNLLRYASYQKVIELSAANVDTALSSLVQLHPELGPVILDGAGQVRAVHRLFLNGQQCAGNATLRDEDELSILTALAGG